MTSIGHMEKPYENKEWLYKKYWNEELSLSKIAILCKVHLKTIWRWMGKSGLPIRSRREASNLVHGNHCNLSQEAIEWINGELLGDGSLYSKSIYSARFSYTSKYFKYIQYVLDILKSFGIEQSGNIYKRHHEETDSYTYNYQSRMYKELSHIYKQWYPEGKKIVPRDLKLTPLTCKQWYIGDGNLTHQKNRKPHIRLCTDSFPIVNVEWLIQQLGKLEFKVTRQKSDNRIRISSHSTKAFLNYIGKCPIECYQYKFNY